MYLQQLMGVEGVIVDLVEEITEALRPYLKEKEELVLNGGEGEIIATAGSKPQFSEREMSFLFKLIPELIQ